MRIAATHTRQRGVSLVEAIVAMAVMAFGMLGVVGMQATLRGNADVASQRSEAVRLAQKRIEEAHAFSLISAPAGPPPVPAHKTFDGIAPIAQANVVNEGTSNNTTYAIEQVVTEPLPIPTLDAVRIKTVVVTVRWNDRADVQQSVRMSTLLTAVPLALQGSLALAGDNSLVQQRSGRNSRIPAAAVDLGDGTSRFTPPGAPAGVTWTFSNSTGFICVSTSCGNPTDFAYRLLAGYVRFATNTVPVPGTGINPPGFLIANLGVTLVQPPPSSTTTVCYTADELTADRMLYACAINAPTSNTWSGRASVTGLLLATSIGDPTAARYRVCRYTTVRAQAQVPTGISNQNHPLDYFEVNGTLINQNYLVISAGDGVTAYTCPEGLPVPTVPPDPSLPPPFGRTWHHQPAV